MGGWAWQGEASREGCWKVKGEPYAAGSKRSGEVAEKPSLQGQGDFQTGGNQAAQPSLKGTGWSSGQRLSVASEHFEPLLLEHPAEFLLRKRLKMAEGQVGHGQPPILHLFKIAKYLPGSSIKLQLQ